MASEFYLVHHIFKPDMAKTWWEHPDGDLNEEEREKRTERWFYAHVKRWSNVLCLGSQRLSFSHKLSGFFR